MKLRFNSLGSDSFFWINKFYNSDFFHHLHFVSPKKSASIFGREGIEIETSCNILLKWEHSTPGRGEHT